MAHGLLSCTVKNNWQQGEEGAPKHKAGGWELIPTWEGAGGVAKVAFFVGKGGIKPKDPFGMCVEGGRDCMGYALALGRKVAFDHVCVRARLMLCGCLLDSPALSSQSYKPHA